MQRLTGKAWSMGPIGWLVLAVPAAALPPSSPPSMEAASPPACEPSVALEGDEAAVRDVAARLEQAGVDTTAERRCVTVFAELRTESDGSIGVKIADTQGRTTDRRVSSTETAAAVIESWARTDLVEPMLAYATEAGPAPAALPAPAAPEPPLPPASKPSFGAGVWLGASLANDDSVWADLGLAGCVELSAVCLGAELRGSFDTDERGRAAELDTDRGEVAGLGTLEVGLDVRETRWRITPGFAVGAGYVASDVDADDSPEIGKRVSRSDVSMRLGATLRAEAGLTRGVRLGGRLGFELAPLARTGAESSEGVPIAGVPRWYVRLAVGVHYDTF